MQENPRRVVLQRTVQECHAEEKMRIRLSLFAAVGLSIGLVLPALAEPKDTADPQISQQRNLLGDVNALAEFTALRTRYVDAFNTLDPAAMAAFYTEDGVVVTPDGWFSGRENIEKWYAHMFQRWHPTNSIRQNDQVTAVGNQAWAFGRWWSTLQSEKGPVLARGFWSAIYVREGDAWKIGMANYNVSGEISLTPATVDTN
jgi:uncharacterized protein (TIGR02246 family)